MVPIKYSSPELGQDENYIYICTRRHSIRGDILEELKNAKVRGKEWIRKYENAQARVEDNSPSYKRTT
jgi:hypothetical protein